MECSTASALQQDARPSRSSPGHLTGFLSASAPGLAFPRYPAWSATACSGARLGHGGVSSCGGSAAISRHSRTADGPLTWQIKADAPGPLAGHAAWLDAAQLTGDGETVGHSTGERVQPGTAPVMEPLQPEACLQALDARAADSQQSEEEGAMLRGEQERCNMAVASAKRHLLACRWAPPHAVRASCRGADRRIPLLRCVYDDCQHRSPA